MTSWNEVFAAAILTFSNRTLPAQMLAALDASALPYRLAGGFFLLAPALVVIFIIRKYLVTTWGGWRGDTVTGRRASSKGAREHG